MKLMDKIVSTSNGEGLVVDEDDNFIRVHLSDSNELRSFRKDEVIVIASTLPKRDRTPTLKSTHKPRHSLVTTGMVNLIAEATGVLLDTRSACAQLRNSLLHDIKSKSLALNHLESFVWNIDACEIISKNVLMQMIASVREFGAKKYGGDDTWKTSGTIEQYLEAALRHLDMFWAGVDNDEESGLSHIAHMLCNIMFVLELNENNNELEGIHATEIR